MGSRGTRATVTKHLAVVRTCLQEVFYFRRKSSTPPKHKMHFLPINYLQDVGEASHHIFVLGVKIKTVSEVREKHHRTQHITTQ